MLVVSLLLCVSATFLSTVSSVVVCRLNETERVSCPDDFYCCGTDQCCKLTFADDQDEETKETLNDWIAGICVRTLIVCGFMVILFILGKSFQLVRRRHFGKEPDEMGLPRYFPLEKNSLASDIVNASALMGSPFYHVSGGDITSYRGSFPV